MAALLATPFAAVPAAGPFQVRRSTAASSVATAPPFATVATSPYDGDATSMASATSYYYAVYDASGQALTISVQAIAATHAIRIGFDDGNAASAPVDTIRSTVTVAPASIRADGLQTATITVVPCDTNGVPLGRGLVVSIDSSILWPATLSAPLADLGDGSYRATVVASTPGTGSIRVVVEGLPLASSPSIAATLVDPSGSLRDLAILDLSGLTSAAGPLAALASQAGAGSPQGTVVSAALADARSALATLANGDVAHDDNVLKTGLDSVLSQLAGVLNSPGSLDPLDVRDAMDDLIGVARMIAAWHVEQAVLSCGACNGAGSPMKVCDAQAALDQADAMRAAVSPNWSAIVDEYAWAVERALQAVQVC
jgi:hypothetical protein